MPLPAITDKQFASLPEHLKQYFNEEVPEQENARVLDPFPWRWHHRTRRKSPVPQRHRMRTEPRVCGDGAQADRQGTSAINLSRHGQGRGRPVVSGAIPMTPTTDRIADAALTAMLEQEVNDANPNA